jgi:hypothetical protein
MNMNQTDKKNLFRLNHSELFKKECDCVRQKCLDAEVTVKHDKEKGVIYLKNYGLRERLLYREPFRIIRIFKLPSEWATSVRDYILTSQPLKTPRPQVLLQWNCDVGSWELFSPVHKKTSQVEVEKALKSFKDFRKLLKEDGPVILGKEDLFMLTEYKKGTSMGDIKIKLLSEYNKVMGKESIRRRLSVIRKQVGEKVRVRKIAKK